MAHWKKHYPSYYAQKASYAPKPAGAPLAADLAAFLAGTSGGGFLAAMRERLQAGQGFTPNMVAAIARIRADQAAKAAAPAPQQIATPAQLGGIFALFQAAGAKLKRPAVTLADRQGIEVRLSVAGSQAKEPGTINVVARGAAGTEDFWLGRIRQDGTFAASHKTPPSPDQMDLLEAFAADPARVAAAYGRASGACCFCARELTDERSLEVGYGETCAGNYGMPYPKKAAAKGPLACIAA